MKLKFSMSEGIGVCGLFVITAVAYNAVLAFVNARGFYIDHGLVSLTEIAIVLAVAGYVGLKVRVYPDIRAPLLFLLFMAMMTSYAAIMNDFVYIKAFRDIFLIVVFFMLGGLASERNVVSTFRFLGAVVLFFMLIENYVTELYVLLFEPASYFANTRGIEELSTDDSGLFRNSLGYEGRFSFNFLSDHRLSSIFLEQVSLANFSMVLAIFTSSFWARISKFDRFFFIFLIVFIIFTNSTRTGIGVSCLILIGYYVFPYMPRYSNFLYMPFILLVSAVAFYNSNFMPGRATDDFSGRIGTTLYSLENLGTHYFTGGPLEMIQKTADSGYTYIILTQTVFGLLAFWVFANFTTPQTSPGNKRFAHSASLFIFINLLIGAAIFSIKVSAPLWVIAGYLYYQHYAKSPYGILYDR